MQLQSAVVDVGDPYAGVDNLEAMEAARRYREFLVRCVTTTVGPPAHAGRLLDFGSGTGTLARPLRDQGYEVTCLEPDPCLRDRLGAAGLETVAGPGHLAPGSFDAALSFNVLEHIDDDCGALREIRAALRPGGRLVLYVPALPMLYSSMDAKIGHLRRYRRAPLERLAVSAGYRVDRCRYADSLGVLATLGYKLLGSRRGDLSPRAVAAYDRLVFPVSRVLDRLTGRVAGKNLLLLATAAGSRHAEGPPGTFSVPRIRGAG